MSYKTRRVDLRAPGTCETAIPVDPAVSPTGTIRCCLNAFHPGRGAGLPRFSGRSPFGGLVSPSFMFFLLLRIPSVFFNGIMRAKKNPVGFSTGMKLTQLESCSEQHNPLCYPYFASRPAVLCCLVYFFRTLHLFLSPFMSLPCGGLSDVLFSPHPPSRL